jgi:NTF2 fold immunity protein
MIRTVVCLVLIGCFQITGFCAGSEGTESTHMTKHQAIDVGLAAIVNAQNRKYVEQYAPFDATFRDGIWSVGGTNPKGVRGGGAPVVEIRDQDKKVLRIYYSR